MPDDDRAAVLPRLWTNPGAPKGQPTLVRLTPAAITLAAVPAADLERVAAAPDAGGDVAGQVIPLSCVRGASGDGDDARLTIRFRVDPGSEGDAAESREVTFAGKPDREGFVAALAEALGPGWRHRQVPMSRLTAGFWTLGPTAAVALIAWGLYAEASRIARGNPPFDWGRGRKLRFLATIAHWVEGQLGPAGVMAAGAALVAIGLVIFAAVMVWPPTRIVVDPEAEADAEALS